MATSYEPMKDPHTLETNNTHTSVPDNSRSGSSATSAIDPETGEIDWECPCLAEALKPPCGEAFKAAFSCFVKSTSEPKGEDCVSLFVEMQRCYLAHPEIYAPAEEANTNNEGES